VMYILSTLIAFFVGGMLALGVRTELRTPEPDLVDAATYNRMFTLHGAVMVFLFIIPSVPAALGNFVLPIMLGAKDVAFPRLNLGSYYLWLIGSFIVISAIVGGGIDTGWTFYSPYSTEALRKGVVLTTL